MPSLHFLSLCLLPSCIFYLSVSLFALSFSASFLRISEGPGCPPPAGGPLGVPSTPGDLLLPTPAKFELLRWQNWRSRQGGNSGHIAPLTPSSTTPTVFLHNEKIASIFTDRLRYTTYILYCILHIYCIVYSMYTGSAAEHY